MTRAAFASQTAGSAHLMMRNIRTLESQAVCKRDDSPSTLHGPFSEAVVACVSDQAGRQVGSSWDGASLEGIQNVCDCMDTSQDNSDSSVETESGQPGVKVEDIRSRSVLCSPSTLAETCTSLCALRGVHNLKGLLTGSRHACKAPAACMGDCM